MVTIIDYHYRLSSKDGGEFITLELQGDVELVQSVQTGRFYATARKCFISCTLTEEVAKTLKLVKKSGLLMAMNTDLKNLR